MSEFTDLIVSAARDAVQKQVKVASDGCVTLTKQILRGSVDPWLGTQSTDGKTYNNFSDPTGDLFEAVPISKAAGWRNAVQAGDVINYVHTYPGGISQHTAIVTGVTRDAQGKIGVSVVDNTGKLNGSLGLAREHDIDANFGVIDSSVSLVRFNNNGNDSVTGTDAADVIKGGIGLDTLNGGGGNDTVEGGANRDCLNGNAGDDRLYGGADSDTLYGGQGNDWLSGGQGDDRLSGDLGNDTLYGDLGSDTLYGGAGADQFCFASGHGRDVIADFSFASGDRIRLTAGRTYKVTSNAAGDAVIGFSGDDSITLLGVRKEQVLSSWFVTG